MLEENWTLRNVVNALREHATGAGRGILVCKKPKEDGEEYEDED